MGWTHCKRYFMLLVPPVCSSFRAKLFFGMYLFYMQFESCSQSTFEAFPGGLVKRLYQVGPKIKRRVKLHIGTSSAFAFQRNFASRYFNFAQPFCDSE